MHIRFYTPWSTMAAQVSNLDDQKRSAIEMAQQSYMPKKVYYYAKGNEKSLDSLAQSFGVNRNDLCRWNEIRGGDILNPGKCLVFYKRGFELEPVHLAQSLQPDSVPEAPTYQLASLRPTAAYVSDASLNTRERIHPSQQKKSADAVTFTYKARRGDTVEKVARRNGIDSKELARANGLKPGSNLKPGQKISLSGLKISSGPGSCEGPVGKKAIKGKSSAVVASVNSKTGVRTSAAAVTSGKSSGTSKGKDSPAHGDTRSVAKTIPGKPAAKSSGAVQAKGGSASKASADAPTPDKSRQAPGITANAKAKVTKTSQAQPPSSKAVAVKADSPARTSTSSSKAAPNAGIAKNTKVSSKKVN
jgi:LysM repeat protein